MSVEEISQGDEPGPVSRRPRWLTAVGVVVVLVAAGIALHSEADRRARAADDAARRAAAARPTPPRLASGSSLAIGALCAPQTDHHTSLALPFTLLPRGDQKVTLESVRPVLPLDGLTLLATELSSGSCGTPGTTTGPPPLAVTAQLLVTFTFSLPPTCPQPLPVGVRLDARQGEGGVITTELPLYVDLGGIAFDTCKPS